jgi:Nucleotidyl transferase AbiEii toxin, Type IV TA system
VATEYPTILDFPAPRLNGYCRETVVAEKFEAMVKLGLANSRMKDFYDIWFLSQQFEFDGSVLSNAITRTFAHRKTQILAAPTALTPVFADDAQEQSQWRAFLRKTRLSDAPAALPDVILVLAAFLLPMAEAIVNGQPFNQAWKARGPWK